MSWFKFGAIYSFAEGDSMETLYVYRKDVSTSDLIPEAEEWANSTISGEAYVEQEWYRGKPKVFVIQIDSLPGKIKTNLITQYKRKLEYAQNMLNILDQTDEIIVAKEQAKEQLEKVEVELAKHYNLKGSMEEIRQAILDMEEDIKNTGLGRYWLMCFGTYMDYLEKN